jgi:hypothetical protein
MACSGSGLIWNCPAGATGSDVNTAISSATSGATITFAAGAYTFSGINLFTGTKGITLICASTPASSAPWGASTTAPCTVTSGSTIFGGSYPGSGVTNNNLVRVSGFTIVGGSQSIVWTCPGGSCHGTIGAFRFDHNTITCSGGCGGILFADTASTDTLVYGVADHNNWTTASTVEFILSSGGWNSASVNGLGNGNNFFAEDNFLTNTTQTGGGAGCFDGWSYSLVIRYNHTTNCRVLTHNQNHWGGQANWEVYNNTITYNSQSLSPFQGGFRAIHNQGGGTMVAFGNRFTPFGAHSGDIIAILNYRDAAYGTNGPGTAGFSGDSGAPTCDGTTVNGHLNNTSVNPVTDGNRTPSGTWYGYPCWRQPGRDIFGVYMPLYTWNNVFTDDGSQMFLSYDPPATGTTPNGTFPPNNCVTQPAGTCDYSSIHMKANREFYDAVSTNANSTPSSPFNGTTGMGFGTLANRPTTCTTSTETAFGNGAAGVGYFATDVGAQGTLYTCSATNTWSIFYTPYTYPHPLVSGVGSVGFTAGSLPFGSVNIGSSSNLTATLSNTSGSSITISSLSYSGTNAADFSTVSTTCSGVITNSNSCTVTVKFTPSFAGAESAVPGLSVAYTGFTGSPASIQLNGTGVFSGPSVGFSPGSFTFASQIVGIQSGFQAIVLTNTGNASLIISGISFSGTNAGDFQQNNNCPGSLGAGLNCTINVAFTPIAVGSRSANLAVADNASGSPQTVPLSGTGVVPSFGLSGSTSMTMTIPSSWRITRY